MNLSLIGLYFMKTIWVEDVDEEEVSVYPGRVYRLSAHVSQTMFTENSTPPHAPYTLNALLNKGKR